MNVIRSRAHNIYTEKINKVALSCEDEKELFLKMEFILSLLVTISHNEIFEFHFEMEFVNL